MLFHNHIIRNAIAWNERRFEVANREAEFSGMPTIAEAAKRDAKRLAHNIETLKARLEV